MRVIGFSHFSYSLQHHLIYVANKILAICNGIFSEPDKLSIYLIRTHSMDVCWIIYREMGMFVASGVCLFIIYARYNGTHHIYQWRDAILVHAPDAMPFVIISDFPFPSI